MFFTHTNKAEGESSSNQLLTYEDQICFQGDIQTYKQCPNPETSSRTTKGVPPVRYPQGVTRINIAFA